MANHVTSPAAFRFWMEGAAALSRVESRGIRVDRGYLEQAIVDVSRDIEDVQARLRAEPDFRYWRRRYPEPQIGSYKQFSEVAFGDLGIKAKRKTAQGGRDAADKSAFEGVTHPLVRLYFEAAELIKARNTYLYDIRREMIQHRDGHWYVHPNYNLNTVVTFRSSSDSPNYQNQPKRNPRMAEIVRRCYIARADCQLGEVDYGQIEARTPCPYCFDPVLMTYVSDPAADMHRDMAAQIFKCRPDQVSKQLRNVVKSAYVFATFYGSYWGLTAPALWEDVDFEQLKLADGTSVRAHLTKLGFTEKGDSEDPAPGSWAAWIKTVDEDFWGNRFRVYAQWKRDWYERYLREGGFTMLTGFGVRAVLDKKQVCNSPIQGASFHLLLWSLVQLDEWLRRYDMRSQIIGQIHDSLILDIHPAERDDVYAAAADIMTRRIKKKFAPWYNVPLVTEAEACPVGGSWFELAALREQDGVYRPADPVKWAAKHGPWEIPA